MRIALLSWESLHSIFVGGLAVHMSELASALQQRGHEVHVFTRVGEGQRDYDLIDGVHYHRCSYEWHPDFIEEMRNMCRSFVHRFFQTQDLVGAFDLVHAHDWLVGDALAWLKDCRGRRGVLTIHSTEYGRCGNNFYGGLSERIREVEKAATQHADRVITVSHAIKQEIKSMYEVPDRKISVVYNGVNIHQFDGNVEPAKVKSKYDIDGLDPMVLFVGRMVPQKGPDLLVETIPAVLEFEPDAKFVFAGSGDMLPQLEERARELDVSDATRFVGFVGNGELVSLYKTCDVVCVPSRNEPFGIFVLEAWGARKPVITTRNGGTNEYISHEVNGLKIDPTPDSVAWGLKTVFSDPARARCMGEKGRLAVETTFNWEATSHKVLSVYEGALKAA